MPANASSNDQPKQQLPHSMLTPSNGLASTKRLLGAQVTQGTLETEAGRVLQAVHLHVGARGAATLGTTPLTRCRPRHDCYSPRKGCLKLSRQARRCLKLICRGDGIWRYREDYLYIYI